MLSEALNCGGSYNFVVNLQSLILQEIADKNANVDTLTVIMWLQ